MSDRSWPLQLVVGAMVVASGSITVSEATPPLTDVPAWSDVNYSGGMDGQHYTAYPANSPFSP
jgi:hypothetical protein